MDNMMLTVKQLVRDGKFYEAQQMYHNAALRMVSQKRAAEARALVREGVCSLIAADKVGMAAELAQQYAPACEGMGAEDASTHEAFDEYAQMCAEFPEGAEQEQLSALKAVIKVALALSPRGAPALHLAAARCHRRLEENHKATAHYVRAEAPVEFAELLVETWRAGTASEQDLFLCRAVLQYLALGNLFGAQGCMVAFKECVETDGGLHATPLNNFVQFLLSAIESESYQLFAMLCDQYRSVRTRWNLNNYHQFQ
jgi:hypothetical protein